MKGGAERDCELWEFGEDGCGMFPISSDTSVVLRKVGQVARVGGRDAVRIADAIGRIDWKIAHFYGLLSNSFTKSLCEKAA